MSPQEMVNQLTQVRSLQQLISNGQTVRVGKIVLASFSNLHGLLRIGSNDFFPTLSSGAANIGQPGTAGRGTISGGSLELSNADIATEFSKLILAERGYEANAKTVATFDQVTQTAINLKQEENFPCRSVRTRPPRRERGGRTHPIQRDF
jgi:flagellar basal body rod protein FlgG